MKIVKIGLLMLIASVTLSSCATILKGPRQTVFITSEPSGAKVEINGVNYGVTPTEVSLKKGFDGQTISLSKEGYEKKYVRPEINFDAISVVNVFFWPGFVIDALSGAMMRYSNRGINVNLDPEKSAQLR
jgi:PEGA domain